MEAFGAFFGMAAPPFTLSVPRLTDTPDRRALAHHAVPTFSFAITTGPAYRFFVSTSCNEAFFASVFEVVIENLPEASAFAATADPAGVTINTVYPAWAAPRLPCTFTEAAPADGAARVSAPPAMVAAANMFRVRRSGFMEIPLVGRAWCREWQQALSGIIEMFSMPCKGWFRGLGLGSRSSWRRWTVRQAGTWPPRAW
ncbi:MAG: hypothetical protein RJA51_1572 [Actinomycetota bacterium]